MTVDDKICLVKGVLASLEADIVSKIKTGRIPAHWAGKEIRLLIWDSLGDNYCFNLDPKAQKNYKNDRIINNI